jgi:hypothetical protein
MDDEGSDKVRGRRRWKAMAGAWRAVVVKTEGDGSQSLRFMFSEAISDKNPIRSIDTIDIDFPSSSSSVSNDLEF